LKTFLEVLDIIPLACNQRKDLEAKMTDVKTAIQSADKEKIKSASEILSSAAQKVGASLYQAQQEAQKTAAPAETNAEEVKPEEKKE